MVRQVHEVCGRKHRLEFAGDVSRIARADAEAHERAGRVPDLRLALIEVLVLALHNRLK
jgi:hypothetical protein